MQRLVYEETFDGVIEMDEALFTNTPNPTGQPLRRGLRQIWAIGMVEENTHDAMVFTVNDRSAAVINRLIQGYVR